MRGAYLHVLTGCRGRASCSCDNSSDRTVKSLSLFLPFFLPSLQTLHHLFLSFYLPTLIFLNLLDPALHPPTHTQSGSPRALVNPQVGTPHIRSTSSLSLLLWWWRRRWKWWKASRVDTEISIPENKR